MHVVSSLRRLGYYRMIVKEGLMKHGQQEVDYVRPYLIFMKILCIVEPTFRHGVQ